MQLWDEKKPLNEEERIEIFLSLVEFHQELMAVFDTSGKTGLTLFGPKDGDNERNHWQRVMRMVSIRKFIELVNDNVYIPKVLNACSEVFPEKIHSDWLTNCTKQFEELRTRSILSVNFGEERDVYVPEIVDDFLNGFVLHGDANKWKRAKGRKSALETVVYLWLTDMENLVISLAQEIQAWKAAKV